MSKKTKDHPLILVCYIDRYTLGEDEIMNEITANFNRVLMEKEANAIAFFLPTDTTERIECINPSLTTEDQKVKINTLIEDISKKFDIDEKGNNLPQP